ncbi:hypothetical protein BC940DRAFT_300670 [Gongronella butleri]|nr:hypothetical protein BC940DRAFT_300670 [Gongronella butleri]
MTTTEPTQQPWLPSLSSIILDDDSFAQDLLRQFDKKQLRLRAEMAGETLSLSSDSGTSRRRSVSGASDRVPSLPGHEDDDADADDTNNCMQRRRRSAGELLRRSSAYLRAKFEAWKTMTPKLPHQQQPSSWHQSGDNENDDNDQQQRDLTALPPPEVQRRSQQDSRRVDQPPHTSSSISSLGSSIPPRKIAIHTTIAIPKSQQQHHHALYQYTAQVQPPIITQYPPRPLKYAPVEPITLLDPPPIPELDSDQHHHPNQPRAVRISTDDLLLNDTPQSPRRLRTSASALQLAAKAKHRISLPLFKILNHHAPNASSPPPQPAPPSTVMVPDASAGTTTTATTTSAPLPAVRTAIIHESPTTSASPPISPIVPRPAINLSRRSSDSDVPVLRRSWTKRLTHWFTHQASKQQQHQQHQQQPAATTTASVSHRKGKEPISSSAPLSSTTEKKSEDPSVV